jgi:NADPH2:quinone reductase
VLAAVIRDGSLHAEERPDPEPGSGEVLVRVHAAGLNGADMMQLRGGYPAPVGAPADIPGLELAGEVIGLGPAAARFAVGDRVMGIVGGGGEVDGVGDGHEAGGVGTAAVQLGRLAGARVTATVRNPDHRGAVSELGAAVLAPEGFAEHGPFDVILELVGAINLADNLTALNTGGRIVVIGTGAGAKGEINLGTLMRKRARIHGSTLRARPLEGKALTARAVERSVLPALAAGEIVVPIAETFALAQASDAYERFQAGGKLGKIILTMR